MRWDGSKQKVAHEFVAGTCRKFRGPPVALRPCCFHRLHPSNNLLGGRFTWSDVDMIGKEYNSVYFTKDSCFFKPLLFS